MCDLSRACEREDGHAGLHMSRHLDETGSEVVDEWGDVVIPFASTRPIHYRDVSTIPDEQFPHGYVVEGQPTDTCRDLGEVDRAWHRRDACRARARRS